MLAKGSIYGAVTRLFHTVPVPNPRNNKALTFLRGLRLMGSFEQFSMAAEVDEGYQARAGYVVNQKKVSPDMTFPETNPLTFQLMIQVFRG